MTKILTSFGYFIRVQDKDHASGRTITDGNIEEYPGTGKGGGGRIIHERDRLRYKTKMVQTSLSKTNPDK